MDLNELEMELGKGAAAIAAFYCSPVGNVSLDEAVYEYLEWFDLAKRVRKLKWHQISSLLCISGASRKSGEQFADGHLSAVVSRQQARAKRKKRPRKEIDGQWRLSSIEPTTRVEIPSIIINAHPSGNVGTARAKGVTHEESAVASTAFTIKSNESNQGRGPSKPTISPPRDKPYLRSDTTSGAGAGSSMAGDAKNTLAFMEQASRLRSGGSR